MYILECANHTYYVGSTIDLARRFQEHKSGVGANFTRKHFPIKLVYIEIFPRIDLAYKRERQIHGWSRKKKEALIAENPYELHRLSICQNETHSDNDPRK